MFGELLAVFFLYYTTESSLFVFGTHGTKWKERMGEEARKRCKLKKEWKQIARYEEDVTGRKLSEQ